MRQAGYGSVDVVINGVALGGAALHRVGRSTLFGEVNNGVWFLIPQEIEQALIFVRDVHMDESHRLATDLFPGLKSLSDAGDRR